MKNFALLNEENLVINISVGDDDWDSTGWVEYTDKNCGIGYTYDQTCNAFIPPKPENATGFDEETCQWIVPDEDSII
jgi:hypothetical protein